jgi:hypothetical protein
MRVSKVEITQIDRQRHRRAQDPDGIPLVNRKITQHQQTAQRAAFPKAKWDYTFASAFRGDPLNKKAETENQAAGKAHDFPWMNHDPEDMGLGEKLEAVHKGQRFRQIGRADQLFSSDVPFINPALDLGPWQAKKSHA